MKKYIIGFLVLGFFAPLFTSALSIAMPECISLESNLRYGYRDPNIGGGDIFTLQVFLSQQGYLNLPTSNFGKAPTGYFGVLTLKAVKDFQRANGLIPDGRVGPITRAKISALTCTDIKPPQPGAPVISGVSGPQSLSINEQGIWEVKASSSNGGNLSYSVTWGDERSIHEIQSAQYSSQQSATFTHSYSQTGTYKVIFTVTSENTIRCITTPCPSNGGSAQASLTVNVTMGGSQTQCEYANPPEGYHWEGGQPYPVCGARLVADNDTAPVINSLSPTSGRVGTTVTITGRGFTRTGNKIKFGGQGSQYNPAYSLESQDGKTLVFTVPGSNYYACFNSEPSCKIVSLETGPGEYSVSVINDNGESNSMTFTVTR